MMRTARIAVFSSDFSVLGLLLMLASCAPRLSATAPLAARIRQLFDDVTALLQEHSPTHMALEAVFSHADHARTAIQMAHARGVVLLAAELRGHFP